MKSKQSVIAIVIAVLMALPIEGVTRAVSYNGSAWVDLCSPDPREPMHMLVATAINSSGQIAGFYHDTTVNPRVKWLDEALLWSGGTATTVGSIGHASPTSIECTRSEARGIDSTGMVVGVSQIDPASMGSFTYPFMGSGLSCGRAAYSWLGGVFTNLATLGGPYSEANAVNGGVIAGCSLTSATQMHAFKYSSGTMTDLGTIPGRDFYCAYAVSPTGTVAGLNSITGNQFLYVLFEYFAGVMTEFPAVQIASWSREPSMYIRGINSSNTVVGCDATPQAFYFTGAGAKHSIPLTGGNTKSCATGINDAGQVLLVQWTTDDAHKPYLYTISSGVTTALGLAASDGGADWAEVYPLALNGSGGVVGWATGPTKRSNCTY